MSRLGCLQNGRNSIGLSFPSCVLDSIALEWVSMGFSRILITSLVDKGLLLDDDFIFKT